MAPTHVPSVATAAMPPATACRIDLHQILYIHTMPYNPGGWRAALTHCHISADFPNLVYDIIHGLPIGNPPPLTSTFLLRNLSSANLYPEIIDRELAEETEARRMSGPYTVEEAHAIFNGHFRTSPVGLVEKHPGDGKWRMICHLSKSDLNRHSTNNWVDLADFPTLYFPTTTVSAYVSSSPFCFIIKHTSFDGIFHLAHIRLMVLGLCLALHASA